MPTNKPGYMKEYYANNKDKFIKKRDTPYKYEDSINANGFCHICNKNVSKYNYNHINTLKHQFNLLKQQPKEE